MKDYKVGLGFDVHCFSKTKKDLVLGGVVIPAPFSLKAVSDGDVVLHALSDALCGAAGLGDIGDYFSPQSKKSKNIDSKKIIKFILSKIKNKFKISNVDITIVAEKPKLVLYKKNIVESLKKILSVSAVNLKIKSKEGLDILGSKNAISCIAVVLII
ncbi:MAG: 2-C-methyl-D-erythritol 2,4-cyclodiphosphate synthase [Candidatus Omnitrophota bacterium]